MPLNLRPLLLAVLALAALVTAGCGNKQDIHTLGETEGIYVDIADVSYQIQMSRVLNPNDIEDRDYFRGLPAGTSATGRDEAWFGVFLRAHNGSKKESHKTASSFRIVDTEENEYEPLVLDREENPFAYEPVTLGPEGVYPSTEEIAGQGSIQGSLLLFKVKLTSLQNRPLEFNVDSPLPPPLRKSAVIDLDV